MLINGDNYRLILSSHVTKGPDVTVSSAQAKDDNGDGIADSVELTFSKAINIDALQTTDFTFVSGIVKAEAIESEPGANNKVNIKINGASGLAVPTLEYSAVSYLGAIDFGELKAGSTPVANATESTLFVAAKSAVTSAETLKTQAAVASAQSLVSGLPNSRANAELQNRLDVVKAELLEGEVDLQAATLAVTAAEQLNSQASHDNALTLVNALPISTAKTDLQTRLTVVQNQISVNAEAAKIASTFTANGAIGATVLPTVASGYSIAVKSSFNEAAYAADGIIVAPGTSNVVYTVTHTVSGKTADTGIVAVTVTTL